MPCLQIFTAFLTVQAYYQSISNMADIEKHHLKTKLARGLMHML